MREAYQKLIEIVKLIEGYYSQNKVITFHFTYIDVLIIIVFFIYSGAFYLNAWMAL